MSDDGHVAQERLIAYALDELPVEEVRFVEVHVRTCRRCAEVVDDVRELTDRLAEGGDDLLEPAPPAPTAALDGVLAAVRASQAPAAAPSPSTSRGRAGLVAVAASLLVVGAVLGGVVGRVTAPGEPTPPKETVVVAALAPGVQGQAQLVAHTWGVEVDLGVTGLRAGAPYTVVVLDSAGAVVGAGGLVGTGEVQASCSVTAPLLRNAATGFRVIDESGKDVLTARF